MGLNILIDTREKRPLPFPCLTDRTTLRTGDYTCVGLKNLVRVERKGSQEEIIRCVTTDRVRFEKQLLRLSTFPVRYLLLDVTPERMNRPFTKLAITGEEALIRMYQVCTDYEVPIMWGGPKQKASAALLMLLFQGCLRLRKEKKL